ncbi:MAG: ATP-binding protein [Promethearchaeota archaeon]
MSKIKDKNIDMKYRKAADIINKAGQFPYPVTDTLIEILKHNIKEENLDFIMAFEKNLSQTIEQLKASCGLREEDILQKVDALAKKGVIFNQPNRTGLMIFRLLPVARQFEYTFMKKLENTQEFRKLATLYSKFDEEIETFVQNNYDFVASTIEKRLPVDRTVPHLINKDGDEIDILVDKELEVPTEMILPAQTVKDIIEKFDDIAVGHCFCRQHKDMLGDPCKATDLRENCFTIGKSARHTSTQGFARMVTKEEALEILKQSEQDGLVHKAYHLHSDISKEEVAICNCCSCCCPNSRNVQNNAVVNATFYLAQIDPDLCIGCGTCIEKCYNNAIFLNDENKAERIKEFCIGCGVCAYFCPENAISMVEGFRMVRMLPPRKN